RRTLRRRLWRKQETLPVLTTLKPMTTQKMRMRGMRRRKILISLLSRLSRKTLLSGLGALSLVVAIGAGACHRDIARSMEKANDLLYRKQYVESERLYRKVLRRLEEQPHSLDETEDTQRMQILDRLGKINALYLHDHPQAIAYYQMLVRYYPKTEQAFAARATIAD